MRVYIVASAFRCLSVKTHRVNTRVCVTPVDAAIAHMFTQQQSRQLRHMAATSAAFIAVNLAQWYWMGVFINVTKLSSVIASGWSR